MNSSVREIPLSGLKVIRGYGGGYKIHEDLPPASLIIRHNYDSNRFLQKIDFNQLRGKSHYYSRSYHSSLMYKTLTILSLHGSIFIIVDFI